MPRLLNNKPRAILAAAVTIAFTLFSGCHTDDGPTVDGQLELCDVTTRACQQDVYLWVSAQRESGLTTPPRTVTISRDEYAGSAAANLKQSDDTDALGEAYRAFGYNRSDSTLAEGGQELRGTAVGGFFSFDTGAVTLITDSGTSNSSEGAVALLAHEYTHAQQAEEGILELFDDSPNLDTDDGVLALRAVLEGEAEFVEVLSIIELRGLEPWQWDYEFAIPEARAAADLGALETDAPSVVADLFFPYPYGLGLNTLAWFQGSQIGDEVGFSAIIAQRDAIPVQSRQFMIDSYSTTARELALEERLILDRPLPTLPEGMENEARFNAGAYNLSLYLRFLLPDDVDRFDAVDYAASLDGDLIVTATNGDTGEQSSLWWLRTSSYYVAFDLGELLAEGLGDAPVSITVDNRDVLLTAGPEEDRAAWEAWAASAPSYSPEGDPAARPASADRRWRRAFPIRLH